MKMNQEAAGEIGVEPADSTTGKEVKANVDMKAPLSRAYYKLDQVWQDFLEPLNLPLSEGSAVDIGACPGGWTQVLVHRMGMSQVVSVDPGRPADRILDLPQVTHAHCAMAYADLEPHGPFSVVVCDASWVWVEVMKQLAEMVVLKAKFMLPSAWIITLKVPFKTLGSIQRHIDRMHDTVPAQLNEMKDKMYPHTAVRVRHQIVHLMANADCERTLIAIFEKA
jgi:23S rRNA C2498 (ribose-2'-O)-methylase RlmM